MGYRLEINLSLWKGEYIGYQVSLKINDELTVKPKKFCGYSSKGALEEITYTASDFLNKLDELNENKPIEIIFENDKKKPLDLETWGEIVNSFYNAVGGIRKTWEKE